MKELLLDDKDTLLSYFEDPTVTHLWLEVSGFFPHLWELVRLVLSFETHSSSYK